MYRYDTIDRALVRERVAQFRDQTRRFLDGRDERRRVSSPAAAQWAVHPTHAPMLRVAIPYGLLSSAQLRTLASIARRYDRGYGHFTTRQNLQYNWPRLEEVPDILAELAEVEMHAIQTSGNCIRNTTSDHLAGVTPRRARGSAALVRNHPAVVDVPPRIHLPAAQIQDRRHRIARSGSRGIAGARRRRAHRARRRRRARFSNSRRRRPRAHSHHRPGGARVPAARHLLVLPGGGAARLQPRGPARQPDKAGSRSWSVRSGSRSSGGAWKPNGS
jgi:hypothetical protein